MSEQPKERPKKIVRPIGDTKRQIFAGERLTPPPPPPPRPNKKQDKST